MNQIDKSDVPSKYDEENGPENRTKPCRLLVHNPDLEKIPTSIKPFNQDSRNQHNVPQ